MVVMPTLLTTRGAIEEHIDRLEIHYLASPDDELYFALLSDWIDSPAAHTAGDTALLDIAIELERIALADEYFISHKLYPNVDFYSGIIYQAMGFPVAMFPVLFAIGRMPGWLAHWLEGSHDSEQKIARPRQIYTGEVIRHLNGQSA